MRFAQDFWQHKLKEMLILIIQFSKLKAYILSNISVIGKIKIMEFKQPLHTLTFDDSPYPYDTPNFNAYLWNDALYG